MENSTREHQRYYIFVSWKNGKQLSQIHKELEVAEGSKALSLRTIYRWIEAFEEGENSIEDASRSGRPHEAVTQGTIAKIEELINEDPHMPIRRIEEEVGVSKERIGHILHDELGLHKVCAKWVPHVLTEENKKNRVEISKQLLEIFECGFLNIVTGDETWINYFTVSSKESNKSWVKIGEDRPQITRTARNSKKRMFCVFFSIDGIIARIVVPKGQNITGKYYANHVLPKVFENFKQITNRRTVKHLLLHHDNAAPHKSKVVDEYLSENKVRILPPPSL